MQIGTFGPVERMSGSHGGTDLVFYQRGGKMVARRRVRPKLPNSPEQTISKLHNKIACEQWGQISPEQRSDWQQYAKRKAMRKDRAKLTGCAGREMFISVNRASLIGGFGLISSPPVSGVPGAVLRVEQVSGAPDSEIRIAIFHMEKNLNGLYVMVRATGAMPSVARQPRPCELRYVCGLSGGSVQVLKASGEAYVFTGISNRVGAGERYGVEVWLVRGDEGTRGAAVRADFIKS